VRLTAGVGEAYTPTAIGADGAANAINGANLFAVSQASSRDRNPWLAATAAPSHAIGAAPVAGQCAILNRRRIHTRFILTAF